MTMPAVYQLFVYGTLRSGFKIQAYEYISRFFTIVGDARVRGKLFDTGEFPAAVPTIEDSFISGELYNARSASEFAWAIGQLDDYEGVTVEPGEPQLYRRELTNVFCNNETTLAWIYWYNGEVSGRPVIESGDIFDYLKNKS